ncbi:hypothetical protein HOU04_gp060 [Synechococcus phage S-T4]|jgi:hypothetical protein|uniref:Uncharacterized protein n=1 Tax=Synechococcus phage S-T4 TaxID=2268578 RepID=A0A385EHP7_9CAUD|nr:hypothetical protein HOU04_gp060 [Synechococcus phage S-T4]AXQ70459.1 hypothetical protein [Synechococcus phage S-T4]
MLAASLVLGTFLIIGAFLTGSIFGWIIRENVISFNVPQGLHPEMYDEEGGVLPDQLIAFRFEHPDDEEEDYD